MAQLSDLKATGQISFVTHKNRDGTDLAEELRGFYAGSVQNIEEVIRESR